jgi:hypothetical protein
MIGDLWRLAPVRAELLYRTCGRLCHRGLKNLQTLAFHPIYSINSKMTTTPLSQSLVRAFAASKPQIRATGSAWLTRPLTRSIHRSARIPAITSSQSRHRPTLQPSHQPTPLALSPGVSGGSRTIFIQTEQTPNADVSSYRSGLWRVLLIIQGT